MRGLCKPATAEQEPVGIPVQETISSSRSADWLVLALWVSLAQLLCESGGVPASACHSAQHSISSMQCQSTCTASSKEGSTSRGDGLVANKSTGTSALRKACDGSTGSARTGVDWSKLPPELLPTILQFVPQQHRFSSCVAVNPAWAAAAVAATRSISIKQDQPKLLQQAWAACAPRFAAQLTHLTLWTRHEPGWGTFNSKLHLPCAGLCSLKVSSCSMQLKSVPSRASSSPAHSAEAAQDQKAGPAGPSWPGLLDSATGLTRLSLTCHELCGTAALLALTDLQDLMLTVSGGSYEQWPHEAAVLLPDSFMAQLSGLTKLTSLQLSATYLQLWSGAGMQHVSHLTRLQRLSLRCSSWDWFGLELKHEQDDKVLFPGSGTVLECLTALTRLKLCGSSVGPLPSLSAMPALEHFVLANCPGWDPAMLAGATGLQHLAIAAPVQGRWCLDAASDDLLLAALQQQTQLTYLKVHQFSPWRADPSALTASTNLRKLHLEEFEAPYGAWGQLCPPERQLQHLTQLEVSGIGVARTVEDLQSLVQGCPALQQLTLRLHLRNLHDTFAEQQFGVLAELSHLTRLIVSNVTDKNIRQLRQLTQLQELHMPNSKLSFAALKRLKRGLKKMQHLKHLTVPLPLPQLSARCTSGTAFTCASQDDEPVWKQLRRDIKVAEERFWAAEQKRQEKREQKQQLQGQQKGQQTQQQKCQQKQQQHACVQTPVLPQGMVLRPRRPRQPKYYGDDAQ